MIAVGLILAGTLAVESQPIAVEEVLDDGTVLCPATLGGQPLRVLLRPAGVAPVGEPARVHAFAAALRALLPPGERVVARWDGEWFPRGADRRLRARLRRAADGAWIDELLLREGVAQARVDAVPARIPLVFEQERPLRVAVRAPARAGLGVRVAPPEHGRPGLVVSEVLPDSAAADAGLSVGDRLLALDGHPLTTSDALAQALAAAAVGDAVTLRSLGAGGIERVGTVRLRALGERPQIAGITQGTWTMPVMPLSASDTDRMEVVGALGGAPAAIAVRLRWVRVPTLAAGSPRDPTLTALLQLRLTASAHARLRCWAPEPQLPQDDDGTVAALVVPDGHVDAAWRGGAEASIQARLASLGFAIYRDDHGAAPDAIRAALEARARDASDPPPAWLAPAVQGQHDAGAPAPASPP